MTTFAGRLARYRRSPAAIRRLERRAPQAPRLVEPAIAALDRALTALDEAGRRSRPPIREAAFEPPSWSGPRSACSRSAPRAASIDVPVDATCRARRALPPGHHSPSTSSARSALPALPQAEAGRRRRPIDKARRPLLSRPAEGRAPGLDAGGQRRAPAAQARACRVHHALDSDPAIWRPDGHRWGRLLGPHQSRHPTRPDDEGRLGRRAVALPARAEGRARRSRLGADAGLRRDRHRRRRRRRRGDRPAPGAACRTGSGPLA